IDIDDSEYWLLSNLELRVIEQLDAGHRYFGRYLDYVSRLPGYARPRASHDMVVSHLGRIKRVFLDCYREYIEAENTTVVITLDTVEAVRGTDLLLTLTQWMKALPGTLFLLSGRQLPVGIQDPILRELQDPHQPLETMPLHLGAFPRAQSFDYLGTSAVASDLTDEEKTKLVHLTQGHPLWLALTVDYLLSRGIPQEVGESLTDIEANLPYGGPMTPTGEVLRDAFRRRLVTPYRDAGFWREVTKRLAVARKNVNQPILRHLMSDRPLPPSVDHCDQASAT